MEPNDSILQVEGLTLRARSDKKILVDRLSFFIGKGETLALVGESGSGKSLTALALLGLLPPEIEQVGGRVLLHGRNLAELSSKELRGVRGKKIGIIFQEPSSALNPVIRLGYQVVESIRVHSNLSNADAKTKAISLFSEVGLTDVERIFDSFPHQVSGGQKQRVMIAMALANDPELLISDEATTALDVTVQQGIINLLARLQATRALSILFITHALGLVAQLAHRVLVLKQGQLIEEGMVNSILIHPQEVYTQTLIGSTPPIKTRLKRIPVMGTFLANEIEVEKEKPKVPLLSVNRIGVNFNIRRGLFSKSVFPALSDVSFSVGKGLTLAIVGESGSGKSTIANVLVGLISNVEGNAELNTKPLIGKGLPSSKAMHKTIQMVFQDPYTSLNPRLTVLQALTEPMLVHGVVHSRKAAKANAIDLLHRVGLLPEHLHRYPHQFSGGQRQRIGLARALSVEPEILILDESVSALDVSVQAQVLNLLKDLQDEKGLTYLFITHDMAVVRFMADEVLVLQNGRIVEYGPASQVLDHPKQAYTQSLINAVPTIST